MRSWARVPGKLRDAEQPLRPAAQSSRQGFPTRSAMPRLLQPGVGGQVGRGCQRRQPRGPCLACPGAQAPRRGLPSPPARGRKETESRGWFSRRSEAGSGHRHERLTCCGSLQSQPKRDLQNKPVQLGCELGAQGRCVNNAFPPLFR